MEVCCKKVMSKVRRSIMKWLLASVHRPLYRVSVSLAHLQLPHSLRLIYPVMVGLILPRGVWLPPISIIKIIVFIAIICGVKLVIQSDVLLLQSADIHMIPWWVIVWVFFVQIVGPLLKIHVTLISGIVFEIFSPIVRTEISRAHRIDPCLLWTMPIIVLPDCIFEISSLIQLNIGRVDKFIIVQGISVGAADLPVEGCSVDVGRNLRVNVLVRH